MKAAYATIKDSEVMHVHFSRKKDKHRHFIMVSLRVKCV